MTSAHQRRNSVGLVAGLFLAYSLVLGVLGTLAGLFTGPHILIPGLVLLAFSFAFGKLAAGAVDARNRHRFFYAAVAILFGVLHAAQLSMLVLKGGWEERLIALLPACIAGLSFWLGWVVWRRTNPSAP